jgi:hypothetical protein
MTTKGFAWKNKWRQKNTLVGPNFDFLQAKYGKLLEMGSFFSSLYYVWELANTMLWETKYEKLLEML